MSHDSSPFPEQTAPSIHRPSSVAGYGMQSSLQPSSLASAGAAAHLSASILTHPVTLKISINRSISLQH